MNGFDWLDKVLGKEGIANTSDKPSYPPEITLTGTTTTTTPVGDSMTYINGGFGVQIGGGGGGWRGFINPDGSLSKIRRDPDEFRGMFPNSGGTGIYQKPHETSKYEVENFIRMFVERLPEDSIEEMQKKELALDVFRQLQIILSE